MDFEIDEEYSFCCKKSEMGGFGGGEYYHLPTEQCPYPLEDNWPYSRSAVYLRSLRKTLPELDEFRKDLKDAEEELVRAYKLMDKSFVTATTTTNQPWAVVFLENLGFTKVNHKFSTSKYRTEDRRKITLWYLDLYEFMER